MAYSITMLSWSVIEYHKAFDLAGSGKEAVALIQWGVDYLLQAHYESIIFAQVRADRR